MEKIKDTLEKTDQIIKNLYWIIADYDAINKQGKQYPYAVQDQLVKASWHIREAIDKAEEYIKQCPEVNKNLYKEYDTIL